MMRLIQPALDLLDEGLRIYRHGFLRFVLIAAIWFVPLALAIGFAGASFAWLVINLGIFSFFGILVISLPLAFYLTAAMSRLAIMIHQNEPLDLKKSLTIAPKRVVQMGCFGILFTMVGSSVVSLAFCICFIPFIFFLGFGSSALAASSAINEGLGILATILFVLLSVALYALSIVASSSVYGAMLYCLQPFAREQLRFGEAISRGITMLRYRFLHNLIAFTTTSLLFYAFAFSAYTAVAVLLPLPMQFLLGDNATVVAFFTAAMVILGMIVVLPPLPIWMALLYERNVIAYEGDDLAAQIEMLPETSVTPHATPATHKDTATG